MVQNAIRKLGDALIPGLLVTLVLLTTTCSGGATPASPETEAIPTVESAPDRTPPGGDQAEDAQRHLNTQTTHIRFDHYSVEQGLSMSVAQCILQDSRGFLWIGTEDGLNRFDGYSFKVYRHDPKDANSLSNSHIRSICEDQSGVLWIGTYGGGLNRFDPETGQFTHYRNDPDDPSSLSNNQVLSVREDRTGALWIGTRGGGLNRFDRETETFTHYQNDPDDPHSLSNNVVNSILEDSSGMLWVGTDGGLNRLDRETDRCIRYQNDPGDPHSLSGNSIECIHEDRSGVLWVGTADRGVNRFHRETETFVHYQHDPDDPHGLSSDVVSSILEDSAGVLWVGTDGGLNRFDRESERLTRYQNDPSDPDSLSDNVVYALLEDQSGGLWIGTHGGGLNRYDRRREQFAHYQSDPDDPNSLSENTIWSIYEDRAGVLWIGTDGGGLNRFDREKGQWRHYRNAPDDPHSLSNDAVVAIYEDESGVLWLGTWGGGLDRFDPETEQFAHYQSDPDAPHSLSSNVVWFIHEDRYGALWIGTSYGLNRFDRETETFTRYFHDPDDPFTLSDNAVGPIYQDRSGMLWIGTHNGLNRFDPDTEQFTRYQNDPDDPQSLSHSIVFSIHEDQSGALWLGTWGGGLNKFDWESGTFTHYRVKDGLSNDVVYGILEDDHGNLWLSTNNGISKFDPRTETFRNYDEGDGLQGPEFDYNAYFKSESGEMFFGGVNGFNAFYPDRVRDNPYAPPIVLTSLTQGGEDVDVGKAVESVTEVTFHWPSNFFEFEFAALSYAQPEENQYAYMLEGFDDWNYIGTRRFGKYTNLPGGTYTLRLKGSNNDGKWNEEGASVKVTIVPPFWATWWFRGIVALVLVGGAIGGYRLRVRSIEARSRELETQVEQRTAELRQEIEQRMQVEEALRQSEREKAVVAERNRLARELHDSVTQSLYGVTLYADAAARLLDTGQVRTATDNLRKLRRTAKEALGEMRLLIFELRPPILEQEGLVAALETRLEAVERRAGLETQLNVERCPECAEGGEGRLPPDVEEALYRIALEALNNALKHAQARSVTISLRLEPRTAVLEIADDGVGFDLAAAQEGGGLGLRGMAERAEQLGGRLTVNSEPGMGTTVQVQVEVCQ